MPHYGLRKVAGPIKRKCENGMNSSSDSFNSGVTLKTMLGVPDDYTIEPSHNPLQGMTSVCLMKAQSELLGTLFPVTTQGKDLWKQRNRGSFLYRQHCGNPLLELMTGARGTQQILNYVNAKGTEEVIKTSTFALKSPPYIIFLHTVAY